jgi:GNAT superfamily N-acetyltransferase
VIPEIILYPGDLADLKPLYRLSIGVDDDAWLDRMIAIERARETRAFTAMEGGQPVGLAGLFLDPGGRWLDGEPPQIIDLAVLPSHQGQGIAKALVDRVLEELQGSGQEFVWLAMNGHSPALHATYQKLGFQLASAQPDWFGRGTCRAWYRQAIPS